MDYEHFTEKFEEMETQMGPLSAFTNYQLQNAIVWGFVWSLVYLPMQICHLVNHFIGESTEQTFYKYSTYIIIYFLLFLGAHLVFHFSVQKLNHQFLEQNSIFEVIILYFFPFCPLSVVFYVTIFEMLLRTCKYYGNIIFHWTASLAMMVAFYTYISKINAALFFINMISSDIFSILIAYDNGKIINPMNIFSYIKIAIGIFLSFYGLYWVFSVHYILQLSSLLLYILNVTLIYFHLQRQIYPLYGNTPITLFILNKILPFTLNLIISLSAFK